MNYTIREAVLSDAEAIRMLNCTEMGYPFPPEATMDKLEKLLRRGCDKIYVASVDGAVVGYVHANDYDVIYAPHMKNIMGIAVAQEHKHRGIGGPFSGRWSFGRRTQARQASGWSPVPKEQMPTSSTAIAGFPATSGS